MGDGSKHLCFYNHTLFMQILLGLLPVLASGCENFFLLQQFFLQVHLVPKAMDALHAEWQFNSLYKLLMQKLLSDFSVKMKVFLFVYFHCFTTMMTLCLFYCGRVTSPLLVWIGALHRRAERMGGGIVVSISSTDSLFQLTVRSSIVFVAFTILSLFAVPTTAQGTYMDETFTAPILYLNSGIVPACL